MGEEGFEERLTAVLRSPLAELVVEEQRLRAPNSVWDWDLPAADREALLRWGLPTDLVLTPAFRDGLITPNVAGVEERRLIAPWQRLHDLGHWGYPSSTGKLGSVVDDGRVLGVTEKPFTAEELHPVMRAQFGLGADFYRPSVYFINSSVARFVEVSWLVSAAFVEFRILDLEEGPENGPPLDSRERRAEFLRACEAHGERRSWGLRALLARVEEIDPAVRADDEEGAWYDAIVDLDPL